MVLPSLPPTRKLEDLPQRPPTPPRESSNSSLQAGSSLPERNSSNGGLAARTPPASSPASSDTSTKRTSAKSQKKVAWSAWSECSEAPYKSLTQQQSIRQLPPSGKLKPAKSILKPYNGVRPVDGRNIINKFAAPHTYPNFATMLESIVQQLAGEDRSSRIDAYLTLAGVLKASENVPDPQALKEKISLLTQFIQRDILAKNVSGTPDASLINNALTLLAFFIWKPAVAGYLSVEFCAHFVDHSISAFGDDSVPKEVMKHLLHILSQQNFSPRIMTLERIRRLIHSLTGIQNHVKGRSVHICRVAIYRRLLKQAKTSMLANLAWMENMFTDMISPIKEVRNLAVALGFDAALSLGTEKQASRAVTDIFQREYNDMKYIDYYARRLNSMITNKHDGDIVPQIWSVVILFLRFRPHQLEQWEFMTLWLHIIEKCFNSSDSDVKMQANSAWNRLVFAIQLDEETAPTMIKMLSKVLNVQLRRKPVGRNAKEIKTITIGSICNLLYYALRPNASFAQLDLYWDEYVLQLIGSMLVSREQEKSETEHEDLTHACEIMSALLDDSPKAWIKNRANDSGTIGVAEVPGIDPKWIRRNTHRVFKVLGPLLEKCFRDLAKWKDLAALLWSRFARSVAAAGAKEVKVSNDTMSSLACMFTTLYKLWDRGPQNPSLADDCQHFQQVFSLLVTTTTTQLGVLPFTEKLLLMGPQENFEIVSTPSQSPFKARGDVKSPLHHIFALIARPSAGLRYDDVLLETYKKILHPFFDSKRSRTARIKMAKELAQLLPPQTFNPNASIVLWRALAHYAALALNQKAVVGGSGSGSGSGSHEQPLGAEYRNIAKLLEIGINLSPAVTLCDWRDLFTTVVNQVTLEAGEGGRAISIIEPLARVLVDHSSLINAKVDMDIAYGSIMLSNAAYPREKHALDAARRRLWGISTSNSKASSSDPYSPLYVYVQHRLQECYKAVAEDGSENYLKLLSDVADLVQYCPMTQIVGLLKTIREGLIPWIVDHDVRFKVCASSALGKMVELLWTRICFAIKQLSDTDNGLLQLLEPLLCAGFKSKHKVIASATVILWNSTFGNAEVLEYPARLKEVLHGLQTIADLQLPSFLTEPGDELNFHGLNFLNESQEDGLPIHPINLDVSTHLSSHERIARLEPSHLPRSEQTTSPQVLMDVSHLSSKKRRFEGTPEPKRKAARKEITPKLRHNDSQIQFAAINSSPLSDAVPDSQLLTDRQREVKERQMEGGVLFANPGSSPVFKIKSRVSRLASNCDLLTPIQDYANILNTQKVIEQGAGRLDDFIASPTPRSRRRGTRSSSDVLHPPSSPPEQQPPKENTNNVSLLALSPEGSKEPSYDIEDERPPPHGGPGNLPSMPSSLQGQAQMVEHIADRLGNDSLIRNPILAASPSAQLERPSTPIVSDDPSGLENFEARTPMEMYVDALSSPAPPTPDGREPSLDEFHLDPLASSWESSGLQETSSRQPKKQAISSNPAKQLDSQVSYSMSEADEDSIIRLMKRYDGDDGLPRYHQEDGNVADEEDHCVDKMSQMDDNGTKNRNYGEDGLSVIGRRKEREVKIPPLPNSNGLLPSPLLESPSADFLPTVLENNEPPAENADSPMLEQYERIDTQSSNGCEGVMDEAMAINQVSPATPKSEGEIDDSSRRNHSQMTGRGMARSFKELLETLRKASLTREEAQEVEELLWDIKGELYAAEKRGRKRA